MKHTHRYIGARLSVMMFLEFFIWGAWFVTVGIYMAEMGMASSIGWAYSVGPIAAILSPFILGMVADRFFATEKILGILQFVGGIALFIAPMAATRGDVPLFIGLLFLHVLCFMPTLGLTNTLAFSHIVDQEKQFPLIRVFGTIGWIVSNVLVSKVLHADRTAIPLFVAGGAAVLMGLYSFTLPHTPPSAKGTKVSIGDILCLDALSQLKTPAFAVFIIASMLICIPLAAYYAYVPVFVNQVGFKDPAFIMSFGQVSELLFMLVMPFFFKRMGVKKMLILGMFAWVIRYGLFAGGVVIGMLPLILIGIILHGICYDFFFVTGQIYVDKAVPEKVRGQAQGLLVLVTQGIGMLVGAQLSARLFKHIITDNNPLLWKEFWLIPCGMAVIVLVVFMLVFREERDGSTT